MFVLCAFELCMYTLNFFFFKQKTAYEMRISDWSSDVCSSDLREDHRIDVVATLPPQVVVNVVGPELAQLDRLAAQVARLAAAVPGVVDVRSRSEERSCRERVCQYV